MHLSVRVVDSPWWSVVTELWLIDSGTKPVRLLESSALMDLSVRRFAGNDAALFYETNRGQVGSGCLFVQPLSGAASTVIACDGARLEREIRKRPYAGHLIIAWSPPLTGGGRAFGSYAIFTLSGKRVLDLPSDRTGWPYSLSE